MNRFLIKIVFSLSMIASVFNAKTQTVSEENADYLAKMVFYNYTEATVGKATIDTSSIYGSISGNASVGHYNFQGYNDAEFFGEGIVLTTGNISSIFDSYNQTASSSGSQISDTVLASFLNIDEAYDIAYFAVDFVPLTDTIQFDVILASEEYIEYTYPDSLPDEMGIFVFGTDPNTRERYDSSQNQAVFLNSANFPTSISIKNIFIRDPSVQGGQSNPNDYRENFNDYFVFDGYTVPKTIKIPVVPCGDQQYRVLFVIADRRDSTMDSGLFLNFRSLKGNKREIEEQVSVRLHSDTIICTAEGFTETARLRAEASGGWGYYSYHWSDSDADSVEIHVNPEVTTSYYVEVSDICEDIISPGTSNTVTVTIQCPVKIPTAFTPNGDGINDKFEIENIDQYKNVNLAIYNRWGKKLFESNHYENPGNWWDGGNNADGSYFYFLEFKIEGKLKKAKGLITKISQ